ncbi:MAG: translation initiation factor IF-2 [Pseudomonadota bacterium]
MAPESKEKVEEGKTIVEKRVKSTVIRRRAKIVEQPETPSEATSEQKLGEEATPVAETVPTQLDAKDAGPKIGPVGQTIDLESKKEGAKGESAAVEIKEVEEEKKRTFGVVGHILEIAPEVKDSWKDRLKRTPRRRKSREEMEMESIKRVGGLKHFAGIVAEEEVVVEEDKGPAQQERVFQPTPSAKRKKAAKRQFKKTEVTTPKAIKKVIRIEDGITVSGLSQAMGVKTSDLMKKLISLEMMFAANQAIDVDTATLLAEEYEFKVEHTAFKEEDVLAVPEASVSVKNMVPRPPVVTVMGHVDHGKTSILDVIRETKVVDQEAGGITQHIGAYDVSLPKGSITFLDTPGHEAFTSMRARGAQATDIAVVVIAANDSIMPQTVEAIDHAKAANVPIIIAINKIDLPDADQERVKKALTEHGLVPEEWGGDIICVPTSAKTKEGIDKLLEMILLQAEMLELKANPLLRPKGVVVEARLDRSRGPVATVLVQEGKLEVGNYIVCGKFFGKVRAMVDAANKPCLVALPSKAVEITGLSGVPGAGDLLIGLEDEKKAKLVADLRQQKDREKSLTQQVRFSLEDLQTEVQAGDLLELNIILKADVQGSAEAVKDALIKLSTDQVKLKIIHDGVGSVNESDVILAKASKAIIIGFNVLPDQKAQATAEREGVDIRGYRIIYELLDEVRKAMSGLLEPEKLEKIIGRAEIREVFTIGKVGKIAGCLVIDGVVQRNANARLLRNQSIVYEGKITSLKRFKDDAKEVQNNQECGIGFDNFNDLKVGDEIVAYKIEYRAAEL